MEVKDEEKKQLDRMRKETERRETLNKKNKELEEIYRQIDAIGREMGIAEFVFQVLMILGFLAIVYAVVFKIVFV